MMKEQTLRTTTRPDQIAERTEDISCDCAMWLLGANGVRGDIGEAGVLD